MKKLLLITLLLQLGVSACRKNEVDPVSPNDAAAVIEGAYTITQLTSNGTVSRLPTNSVVGKLVFTRTTANQSTMQILLTSNGAFASDVRLPVYLGGPTGTVELYADASRSHWVGTAKKNFVKIVVTSNGTDATMEASR